MENTRICRWCGKKFTLTKSQMRQKKEKWAVNCSRSCARKAQHARNYKKIRKTKKCKYCKELFMVPKHNWDKIFCSIKCSSLDRFGDPKTRKKNTLDRLNKQLEDTKYMKYMIGIAKHLGIKYSVDWMDLIQSYFVSLCEGQNSSLEHVAMNEIRKEYNRGLVGKRKCRENIHSIGELMKTIENKTKNMSEIEVFEYLHDLKSVLNEDEFKIAQLKIMGFGFYEAYSLRGKMTKQTFYTNWNTVQIKPD